MQIPLYFGAILFALFYMVIPIIIWIFFRNSKFGKIAVSILCVMFLIVLFWAITSRISVADRTINVAIDFTNYWFNKKLNFSLLKIDKVDFLINITMLIPIGLVVVFFNRKTFKNKIINLLVVGVIFGIILESLQYILPVYRSVQLSDVVLNALSVLIGGVMGILYDKIFIRK